MGFVLAGLILLPLFGGLALGLRSLWPVRRPPPIRHIAILITGLVLLCALVLPLYGDLEVHLHFTWLPGTGDMSLHVGGVGIYAVIVTVGCALLLQRVERVPEQGHALVVDAAWLMALAAANVAFLAGHFLGRYVALEVVGFCVALLPLLVRRDAVASRFVYLLLRVGDAGLLVAILMLMQASGTLTIDEALLAGESLDAARLAWVVGGLLMAVWVKMGAWPFQDWLRAADGLTSSASAWFNAIVMPNLGLYLLYRITPLLQLSAPLRLGCGGLSAVGILFLSLRLTFKRGSQAPAVGMLPVYVNGIASGLLLLTAAGGLRSWLGIALWAGTPLRAALWWLWRSRSSCEVPSPASQISASERSLLRLARSLQRGLETGILDRGVTETSRGVVALSLLLHRIVEQEGLEGTLRAVTRGVQALALRIQHMHSGKLRQNLLWVMMAWALVVVWLIVRGW